MPNFTVEGIAQVLTGAAGAFGLGAWLLERQKNKGVLDVKKVDELHDLRVELRGDITRLETRVAALEAEKSELQRKVLALAYSYGTYRHTTVIMLELMHKGDPHWAVLAQHLEDDHFPIDEMYADLMPVVPDRRSADDGPPNGGERRQT